MEAEGRGRVYWGSRKFGQFLLCREGQCSMLRRGTVLTTSDQLRSDDIKWVRTVTGKSCPYLLHAYLRVPWMDGLLGGVL